MLALNYRPKLLLFTAVVTDGALRFGGKTFAPKLGHTERCFNGQQVQFFYRRGQLLDGGKEFIVLKAGNYRSCVWAEQSDGI